MQRARRNDPYPFIWEIPAEIFAGVLLVLVLGVHLGRAVANMVAGAGWAWPAREELFAALPSVLGGMPALAFSGPCRAAPARRGYGRGSA